MLKLLISICAVIMQIFCLGQSEIKVMSYNIRLDLASDGDNRWDLRKEKVAALMNYYEAEIIGGQEVQHHQLAYLLSKMPAYDYIGVGRDDGKTAGEYSCIFYKKDKFSVVEQGTFWLSATPDTVSLGWDAANIRVCTYGLFRSKKTKQSFWVINTHMDHVGKTARLESAKLINQRINELNIENYPVILMGDFNARPEEPPILFMNSVMQNARSISKVVYGPADTWNGFKFSAIPDGCIDYIFIHKNQSIIVEKFATITDSYELKYPSDHFPVIASLTFNR